MLIHLEKLGKSFGEKVVLHDVSASVEKEDRIGIVGQNGAGKTTLLKILTGVYTRDGGTVIVDGKEVTYKNPQEAEKAGIVFIQQELNVLFDLTVEENLFLGKEIKKGFGICDRKAMRVKAEETLKRLGVSIPTDKVMSGLSVGQQQMIEICKALMVDAKVIIMDEPTRGIDVGAKREIHALLRQLAESGVGVIVVSSELPEVIGVSDRVAVMYLGTVAELTSSESLYKNPLHPYTKALLSAIPIPDPKVEEEKERIRLTGEIPSPIDPPPGCRFAGRCRFAADRCRRERPELLEVEEGHLVACHLYEKAEKRADSKSRGR